MGRAEVTRTYIAFLERTVEDFLSSDWQAMREFGVDRAIGVMEAIVSHLSSNIFEVNTDAALGKLPWVWCMWMVKVLILIYI